MDEDMMMVDYKFETTVCRFIDGVLWPSRINVSVTLDINEDDDTDDGLDTALRRIDYWINHYVKNCVIVEADAQGFDLILNRDNTPRVENIIMITPDSPTDDHLALLFQSKLAALSGGAFDVYEIEITSSNASGLVVTFLGDPLMHLPDMEDWIDGPTWFDKPWWERNDASTIDTMAGPDADLSILPVWADDMSYLNPRAQSPEAIVLKGDFKPRVVSDTEVPSDD